MDGCMDGLTDGWMDGWIRRGGGWLGGKWARVQLRCVL